MEMRWILSHYSKLTLYPHLLTQLTPFRMSRLFDWIEWVGLTNPITFDGI